MCVKVVVSRSGRMVLVMRVTGVLTRPMVVVVLSTLMGTCTRVSGSMIKHMERVLIHMLMEVDMKVIGMKISNMDMELKDGLMVHLMKASINQARSMVKVNLPGQTPLHSLVNSLTIILMAQEYMSGLMGEYSMGSGKIIKWKGMVLSHGLMVEDMLDSTLMT